MAVKVVQPPSNKMKKRIISELDMMDTDKFEALMIDLNGDKIQDYIFLGLRLCGNGGCPYAVFDGASERYLGQFFGSPVYVMNQKINGMPVIHTYSHQSANSGLYTCYVYDGKKYAVVSSVLLIGDSVKKLFEELKGLPRIKNKAKKKDTNSRE